MVTLSLTVSQQDAWLFEWTRRFAAHAQNAVTDEQVLAAVHRGLIRLTRSADGTLRWVLGRDGVIVVEGRTRRSEENPALRWSATG